VTDGPSGRANATARRVSSRSAAFIMIQTVQQEKTVTTVQLTHVRTK